jgi:hypothetical protein
MKESLISILCLTLAIPVFAAEAPSMADCAPTIRRVCAGYENQLETCLAQRADQLPASCRDQLKEALSLIQSDAGLNACIQDVKQLCAGLSIDAMASCVKQKKDSLSPACQKRLEAMAQPASE